MSAYRSLSLWHDTLPADDQLVPRPALGGTPTSTWRSSAAASPDCGPRTTCRRRPLDRIAIIERDIAGFGASGRNGGWCSALLPMGLDAMAALTGATQRCGMQTAMHDTVDEVGPRGRAAGIDCHYAKGGYVEFGQPGPATCGLGPSRRGPAGSASTTTTSWLTGPRRRSLAGASSLLGALSPPPLRGDPPRSAGTRAGRRGRGRGVAIYEDTPVSSIEPAGSSTEHGAVRAEVVVRATEGFTRSCAGEKRTLVPIYSLMIATEPLADALWDEIGLRHARRSTTAATSSSTASAPPTGGSPSAVVGAPTTSASAIRPEFDRDERVHDSLHETLRSTLPGDRRCRHHAPLGWPARRRHATGTARSACDRDDGHGLGRRLRG